MSAKEIKSAFDLAMERMAQRGEGMEKLSDEKKAQLAELSARTKAKTAEIEIMYAQKLAEVRASGDAEKITKVEDQMKLELRKLKESDEGERLRIRSR
jgi:hypothetical protein